MEKNKQKAFLVFTLIAVFQLMKIYSFKIPFQLKLTYMDCVGGKLEELFRKFVDFKTPVKRFK
jgi:hypothetical protein